MNPQKPDQNQTQTSGQADHRPAGPPQSSGGSSRHVKVLLVLLLVLLPAAGAAWFFVDSTLIEEKVGEGSPRVEVVITNEGFTPGVILVHPGTTVVWVNKADEPHWVASNPHPDHDALPGFDAGDAIFPDKEHSYTFNETGEYDYHDHLEPETNGTVVVEKQE